MDIRQKEEKKVEYLELIYDLIFVYMIGRNNSLLRHAENGFVAWNVFFAYVLCTLAVIQIWNFTTFYINIYGRNSVRDHIFLCINMYLLYYMADGTGICRQPSVYRYAFAWALILINIGTQHLIEIKSRKNAPRETKQLRRKAAIILTEAGLVLVHALVYRLTDVSIAYVPILFGMVATTLSGRGNAPAPVDFAHLTERAMLYVVFTFGEMIIAVSSYFDSTLTANTIYFSIMAFLIVVGLFLSYGTLYNRIIDREKITTGTTYMLIHVFLIFALCNISAALEFMREESIALLPKTLFLTGSFLVYYTFLFMTERFAKKRCTFGKRFHLLLSGIAVSFAMLMILFRKYMYMNIALTVVYVFGIFFLLHTFGKKMDGDAEYALEGADKA